MVFFDQGIFPVVQLLEEPLDNAIRTQESWWNMKIESHGKRQSKLEHNMVTICSVILGKCGSYIRARLEVSTG